VAAGAIPTPPPAAAAELAAPAHFAALLGDDAALQQAVAVLHRIYDAKAAAHGDAKQRHAAATQLEEAMKAAASSQRTADLTAAAGPAAAAALDSMRAGLADATRGALADEQEARRKAEQMGERIKLWLQSGMEEGAAGGSSRIVFSSQAKRALPVIAQHARALRSAALDAASGVSMWEKTLVTAGVAAAKGQQRRELGSAALETLRRAADDAKRAAARAKARADGFLDGVLKAVTSSGDAGAGSAGGGSGGGVGEVGVGGRERTTTRPPSST